jgi:peptidoglycan/LPS O-acetylase OafA/YrhL
MYVILMHITKIPKPPLQVPVWLQSFLSFGGSGVTFFFVISGFSMALTWDRHCNTHHPYVSFYTARFFRIAPLFYFLLLMSLVRDYAFKGPAGLHSLSEITSNIFFTFNFNEAYQTGIVWASWTIGVECFFYALFPILAEYTNTLRRSTLFLLAFLSVSFTLAHYHQMLCRVALLGPLTGGIGAVTHFPIFIFGILAFRAHKAIQTRCYNNTKIAIAFGLGFVSLCGLSLVQGNSGVLWLYLSALLYAFLLLSFCMAPNNVLVNPITFFTGRISYSLYLVHPSIVYLLRPAYMFIYSLALGENVSLAISVLLTLVVIFPLSYATYRIIETPMLRIGKKLFKASSGKSDRGLSGGSVLPQPKMAEKRGADEQTSTQEPFSGVQGEGGIGGDLGREDNGGVGRAGRAT